MDTKFSKWMNSLDMANLNDLQPNEGMEMGWYECKKEVLKLLDKYSEIYGYEYIKREIENNI